MEVSLPGSCQPQNCMGSDRAFRAQETMVKSQAAPKRGGTEVGFRVPANKAYVQRWVSHIQSGKHNLPVLFFLGQKWPLFSPSSPGLYLVLHIRVILDRKGKR